ncbi:nicotinamide-nucleotide amidohydrolase family protein [Nocardioides sp. GY 10127]|uniref:nicotinamide-nucleotide amidohydrolase family protein n=1 Tax=Nocardioides sp. GY 10127 TaxID=2569762 RepID=UPI0010A81FD3|nr:nicotinamide-nucleotide amidohydrolase family protein [Nocardioides sp. GY 10127]TIC86409.1 nicotinamide-nucleotide amidohydrolase family protein [Nocardioides sp. GY 10127]
MSSPARPRAAVVVTGTEVLTGRVKDANGGWLADRFREAGVEIGTVVVVGDRPEDLHAALSWLTPTHALVVTTGGLGPTADDLTAEVVGAHQGRPLEPDEGLRTRVQARIDAVTARNGWSLDPAAAAEGARKQSLVPRGATVIEPVGTAPGLVVPPARGTGAPVLVLPGPPGELQGMWPLAVLDPHVAAVLDAGVPLVQERLRLWGTLESDLAALLRRLEDAPGSRLSAVELTTCIDDVGELEVVGRFSPDDADAWHALVDAVADEFGATLFSPDGRSLDALLAEALRSAGATVATAESCTAGMLASRLADLPGSSDYLQGGFVVYANEVKRDQVGVPEEVLAEHGAVSAEVARALADGARTRLGTTWGVGITGVAGPGGGTPEKPVGLVHVCLTSEDVVLAEALHLRGPRERVRRRTVVTVMHRLLAQLRG